MNIREQDRELGLIGDLCRELAKLGLSVSMSDARPAVVIRTSARPIWITVDSSGTHFEWTETHPVVDLAGAAAYFAEQLKSQASGDLP